jgi:hypothetical protein
VPLGCREAGGELERSLGLGVPSSSISACGAPSLMLGNRRRAPKTTEDSVASGPRRGIHPSARKANSLKFICKISDIPA